MPDVYEDEKGEYVVDLGSGDRVNKALKDRTSLSEYSGIDLASGFPRNTIWVCKDGRKIAIVNLTDSHLLNIIAFLRRLSKRWKVKIAVKLILGSLTNTWMFDHVDKWTSVDVESLHDEILIQVRELEAMDVDAFLRKIYPIYSKLMQECYKRKLLVPKAVESGKVAEPPKEPKPKRKKKPPKKMSLIEEMEQLRKTCDECDGVEVHQTQWDVAAQIIKKHPGYSLGAPRGPDKAWRRLYPPRRQRC